MLEPTLQDGQKIPKWHPRACLGMFLGFSPFHSSLVPLLLNTWTGKISRQYHVIFDDKFETVESLPADTPLDTAWLNLFKLGQEYFLDEEFDDSGKPLVGHIPELDKEWLPPATAPIDPPPGGVAKPVAPGEMTRRSPRLRLTDKTACKWGQPASFVANRGRTLHSYHPSHRLDKAFLSTTPILTDGWSCQPAFSPIFYTHFNHDPWDSSLVHTISPWALAACTSKYTDDSPSWNMAVNGPFQEEFHQAMEVELNTLENEMESWELVPRTSEMHVLPSTWAFKIKRFPDGLVKKFKARFCVQGDRQKEGIDYFETWSPVTRWETVRTMMVLAAKLNLKSAQCDITAAFLHARLKPNEEIYVNQPRGFTRKEGYVLKLRRTLYGLKQAPRYFFEHLSERIQCAGLTQSKHDPCLFLSSSIVVIVYIDDILAYARDDVAINNFTKYNMLPI